MTTPISEPSRRQVVLTAIGVILAYWYLAATQMPIIADWAGGYVVWSTGQVWAIFILAPASALGVFWSLLPFGARQFSHNAFVPHAHVPTSEQGRVIRRLAHLSSACGWCANIMAALIAVLTLAWGVPAGSIVASLDVAQSLNATAAMIPLPGASWLRTVLPVGPAAYDFAVAGFAVAVCAAAACSAKMDAMRHQQSAVCWLGSN